MLISINGGKRTKDDGPSDCWLSAEQTPSTLKMDIYVLHEYFMKGKGESDKGEMKFPFVPSAAKQL